MPCCVAALADAHEGLLRDHVIEEGIGKEGIAPGALMDEVIELRGQLLLAEAAAEELIDGLPG